MKARCINYIFAVEIHLNCRNSLYSPEAVGSFPDDRTSVNPNSVCIDTPSKYMGHGPYVGQIHEGLKQR